ncbi:MAG: exopolyphosphatase [Flavobacteriales bacterium]
MIAVKTLAAIDIGSNAIRLLIDNAITQAGNPKFNKVLLLRLPIRLGTGVFGAQRISPPDVRRMVKAMQAFQLVMELHGVADYRAFATSAMRTAANGESVAKRLRRQTGVDIKIIDGKKEAAILFKTGLAEYIHPSAAYLFIDVGGGSTELTLLSKNRAVASRSFNIGTVRFLNGQVTGEMWREMRLWVREWTGGCKDITAVGSGGNINEIFKMSGRKIGQPLNYHYVCEQYKKLKNMTYEQRVADLGLNLDRADVIVPALRIYCNAMRWLGAKHIYVPKVGLADGMIRSLYFNEI